MVALHVYQVWWTLAYKPLRTRRHNSRRTLCQDRSARACVHSVGMLCGYMPNSSLYHVTVRKTRANLPAYLLGYTTFKPLTCQICGYFSREYIQYIALTRSFFCNPKSTNYRFWLGSAQTRWGSSQRSPRPIVGFRGLLLRGRGKGREGKGRGNRGGRGLGKGDRGRR